MDAEAVAIPSRPYHNQRFHPADYPARRVVPSVIKGLGALSLERDVFERLDPEDRRNILAVLSNPDLLR